MNHSFILLIFMAYTLGMRHGFDLDHLSIIDSITRSLTTNARLSKCAGLLFSFGHGLVVIIMSLIIASGLIQSQAPLWLKSVGSWISIVFLFLFGFLTLWNIIPNAQKLPTSFQGIVFKKILGEKYNPILIMLIGALFALSFDTFSQVALLSISASILTNYLYAILLGVTFMFGMMTTDGLNGIFVAYILQSANNKALILSRILSLIIALFSITLGVTSALDVIS